MNQVLPFGAALAEHTLLSAGLQPQALLKDRALSEEQQGELLEAIRASEAVLAGFSDTLPRGYIWQSKAGVAVERERPSVLAGELLGHSKMMA